MEVVMDVELARKAIALVDLTDLTDGCTPDAIDALCERASRYGTAAVCVWPDFVASRPASSAAPGFGSPPSSTSRVAMSARSPSAS
jgi:deoxyribose-phosphate aldolase